MTSVPSNRLDTHASGKGSHAQQTKRTFLKRLVLVCLLAILLMATVCGWLIYRAHQVSTSLSRVTELAQDFSANLRDFDVDKFYAVSDELTHQTSIAREASSDPLWKAAEYLPFVGNDFEAVSQIAVSVDDIAAKGIPPLLDGVVPLKSAVSSQQDASVNTGVIKEAAPSIVSAANVIQLSYDRLSTIDSQRISSLIGEPLETAKLKVNPLRKGLNSLASIATVLPDMLGDTSPRRYLVLIQNNAEVRATGGIPGAVAVIEADKGRPRLIEQSTAADLGAFNPALKVDPEQEALFTSRLGTYLQNVNLTPDFPTAASTAQAMWESAESRGSIDGVLSVDPIALSYMMDVSGDIELSDPMLVELIRGTDLPRTLNAENLTRTLLSDIYNEIPDPKAQDAYFAAVASSVFSELLSRPSDGFRLGEALAKGTAENRIRVWSSEPAEQAIIADSRSGGSIARGAAQGASFGAYFNDGTGAKMDYYVARTAQLLQSCQSDGYSRYTVRLTISNNAPEDAAATLPAYVTGGGTYGVEPGRVRTNYVVYGPALAFVETATLNGASVAVASGKHGQRPVGSVSLELAPGETAELDVVFSRVVQDSEPLLEITPTIQSLKDVIIPFERENCG